MRCELCATSPLTVRSGFFVAAFVCSQWFSPLLFAYWHILACVVVAENKKEIRPLGGLRSIIDCLLSEDAETRRYALACLINLSNDGTLFVCVRFTYSHYRCVCLCVYSVCRIEENEHEVRVQGGLSPILTCVKSPDLETRRFALRLLCNLSISGTF